MVYDPRLGFDPELGLEPQYNNPYQGQQGSLTSSKTDYSDLIKSIGAAYAKKKAATYAAQQMGLTGGSELASTEAANAAWNSGADAASQAAWNSGAEAAMADSAATTGSTGATTGTTGTSSALGTAANVASLAGITYLYGNNWWQNAGKDIYKGRAKKEDWIDSALASNLVTGWINPVLNGIGLESAGRMLGAGKKGKDQLGRDGIRKGFQTIGISDKDHNVTLLDGSKFNVGKDSGTKYKNVGVNIDGKTERQAFDVDFSNPIAKELNGEADQVVRHLLGEKAKQKQVSDAVGMLVNAATSNAKDLTQARANLQHIVLNGANVEKPVGQPSAELAEAIKKKK